MALFFVIPFRSSQTTTKWPEVCALLRRTLGSLRQQTHADFRALIVGREPPDFPLDDDRVEFVPTSLPIPDRNLDSQLLDQITKMQIGLNLAREQQADFVMFVDADDVVSNRLAAFVNERVGANGFYLDSGYEYEEDVRRLKIRRSGFHLRTSTSHVAPVDALAAIVGDSPWTGAPKDAPLYHRNTARCLRDAGHPLAALPFPAAVYVTDNGANMWWTRDRLQADAAAGTVREKLTYLGSRMNRVLISRPLTRNIREEFALHDLRFRHE